MAWHVEAFAREKRLKPLKQYLSKPDVDQRATNLLGALRGMKRKGIPMTIERIHRKG
jgi:hypothetical protein